MYRGRGVSTEACDASPAARTGRHTPCARAPAPAYESGAKRGASSVDDEAEQRKHDAALCGSADKADEPGVRAALEAGATPRAVKPHGWPAARDRARPPPAARRPHHAVPPHLGGYTL